MKGKSLLFGIVLAAQVAFGAEDIGQFAKQSLGLDLTSIPFGELATNNGNYVVVGPPIELALASNEQSYSWRSSAISKQYHEKYPNRELVFGFHDGRLAAVRVTIDAINHMSVENRSELLRLYDELFSENSSSRVITHKFPFDDGSFRLKVSASCGLERQSLFVMNFHLTPADIKKSE